jgi:PAS domain S-box-containing protein
MSFNRTPVAVASVNWREWLGRIARIAIVAALYGLLAKLSLGFASVHPSASPIWPPTGLALAAVLLLGYEVWPAIFVAALITNLTTAGSLDTSLAIAVGNTLEGLVGAFLINRWSAGRNTFDTPWGVTKFTLISLAPGTMISASLGVGALTLAGYAGTTKVASIWLTWWMGDLAGALLVAPVIVLWAQSPDQAFRRSELARSALVFLAAIAVGLIAFSPLLEQTDERAPLAFLAILPLMWAALRRGQRDTATAALILSGFAVWGALRNGGPFARTDLNELFLLVIAFIISISVPSLALSADVAARGRAETYGRFLHDLSDKLRRLGDPDAIMSTVAADLGHQLAVSRTGYSEVDEEGFGAARAQWHVDRLPDVTGRFPRTAFAPDVLEELRSGRTRIVEDIERDPRARSSLAIYRLLGARALITVPLVKEGRLRAALHVAQDRVRRWSRTEVELCEEVAERTWAAVERARAEAAVAKEIAERKRNEERLENLVRQLDLTTMQLLEQARVLDLANVLVRDIDDRITLWNEGAHRLYGWTKEEALGRIAHELLRTRFPRPREEVTGELLANGSWDGELVHLSKDGRRVVSQSHWELRRTAEGAPAAIVETNTDITERKRHEEHIHLVMRELSHRSKNLLAIVLSIARQVARRTDDYRNFESAFSARLGALADTHDLLVAQDWRGASMYDLARAHLAPFGDVDQTRLVLAGPDLTLQPKAAEQIGLAVHELATNAARYGAFSSPSGTVRVEWKLVTEPDADEEFGLVWTESNGPEVEQPKRQGFGHMVLTRVVAGSLQGKSSLDFASKGICWTMTAPAKGVVGEDEEWGYQEAGMGDRKSEPAA